MKIKIYNSTLSLLAASVILFAGCSEDFLREKNFGSSTEENVYGDYEGAKGRVNYLYSLLLPITSGGNPVNFTWFSTGDNDRQSVSTEEYGGFATGITDDFVRPNKFLDASDIIDYFHQEKKISAPWGVIRNCNDVIQKIEASVALTDEQKEELLGQALFFRAWAYYRMVEWYGGVPIITEPQDPTIGEEVAVPRSTTKECVDFICDDLQRAADMLPLAWPSSSDYGRITKGAALALMGRTRLHYASPLYNRADDKERWKLAFEANEAAYNATKYEMTPGKNASGWAASFATYANNKEAIFFTLFNNISSSSSDFGKNNQWEQRIRPKNLKVEGANPGAPTAQIIDLFPMADGKRPATLKYNLLPESTHDYDDELFFLNRDPRFYRTFAFPGVKWAAANVSLTSQHEDKPELYPYQNGAEYELWSYAWDDGNNRDKEGRGFYADGLDDGERRSIYIRKRSNDTDISDPLYAWDASNGFKISAAPYMEIRFGEVLLNYAESACGYGEYDKAVAALKEIRRRVGYTAENNFGLDDDLASNRKKLFAAILYERQIELAYEGKRFQDMRRWLLWDGGANKPSDAPNSWIPSGWENNTCTYLGFPAFNRTTRTEIQVTANETAAKNYASDPLPVRPAALDINGDLTPTSAADLAKEDVVKKPIDNLVAFYKNNLHRKEIIKDSGEVSFDPRYYFIGLKLSAQQNNAENLLQTIGWSSYYFTGNGTFDPIAE